MKYNKLIVGFLLLLVSASIVYISYSNVRIRVDIDKTTFYIKEKWWKVAGRERFVLFDGTSRMNRIKSKIKIETFIDDINKTVKIIRTTPYIRGPLIKETYFFSGKITDIALFPISHKIEVFNASNYFLRYEAWDLEYTGDRYKLTGETELIFGRMKIILEDNYRWAWVYKKGKIIAQYDIDSDYEVYNFRMFDPVVLLYLNKTQSSKYYEQGYPVNITGNSTGNTVCLTIEGYLGKDNFTCGSSPLEYTWTAESMEMYFNDSTTFKNLTANDTVYIEFDNESIDFINTEWNFTGYLTGGNYPEDIEIDIGSDGIIDKSFTGYLNGTTFSLDSLNDSSTAKNITFPLGGGHDFIFINLPRQTNISSAFFNVSGYLFDNSYEQDTENASAFSGTFVSGYPATNAYDEDWSTSARVMDGNTGTIYENYTLQDATPEYINITISRSGYPTGLPNNARMELYLYNFTYETWTLIDNHSFTSNLPYNNTIQITEVLDFIDEQNQIFQKVFLFTSTTDYRADYIESKIYVKGFYLKNPYINVGNDLDKEWNYTGLFDIIQNRTIDLSLEFNDYLWSSDCTGTTCDVPIVLYSETAGILQIDDIDIQYNPNPIDLNITRMQELVEDVTVNISVNASKWGTLKIDALNFSYYGSQNYTVFAHTPDYSTNSTKYTLSVVFSNYTIELPEDVDYWEVFPTNATDYNVTPYGQTDTQSIWNLTVTAYDRPVNFSMKYNESLDGCINISADTDNTKDGSTLLNHTDCWEFATLKNRYENATLWMWVDLFDCNTTALRYITPYFQFKSYCDICYA